MSVESGFKIPRIFMQHCERIKKVWGDEYVIVNLKDKYCSKFLVVKPGYQCSRHRHRVKSESFVVVQGQCVLQIGEFNERTLRAGDQQDLVAGTWHRFRNTSRKVSCIILEVSQFHDDGDVERLISRPSGKIVD